MRTFTPRQKIEQYRIDNEAAAEIWRLPELAQAAGTEFKPAFPIFIVVVDGEPFAFYYATPQVVIRPTVPPAPDSALSTRRKFYEVAKLVIAVTKRSFGNPLWLVDTKSELSDPELLAKLGLTQKDLKVFEVA